MPTVTITSLIEESKSKESAGDIQGAYHSAAQALELDRSQNNGQAALQTLQRVLNLACRIGKYKEGRQLAEAILAITQASPEAVDALVSLGIIEAETNDLQSAEQRFYQAAEISRAIQYTAGLARALHNQAASVFYIEGKFTLALATMDEASQLKADSGGETWGLPFLQALIYQTIGDRKRARQALDAYLPLVRPGTRMAGGYYYLWSRLALDEEELEKAEEYLYLALRIANQSGSPDLNVWTRLEYSRLFRLRGEPATAHTWAEDAFRFAERIQSIFLIGQATMEQARTCWESGDRSQALDKIELAIQKFSSLKAEYDLAYARFLQAVWLAQEEKPGAVDIWQQAVKSVLQGGYTFLLERERKLAFPMVARYIRSRDPAAREPTEAFLQYLDKIAPPPLRVYGLGQFRVLQGRRPVADVLWQRRKAGDMFRFLLLQPGHSASREVILEELWPEHPLTTSLDLFHQATSTLRHILEPDLPDKFPSRYLTVEGERVFINLPPGSMVDFEHFEQEMPIAIQSRQIGRLQEALALYTDDLFPMDLYLDWSASRRQELVDLFLQGQLVLGQAYLDQQRFYQAANCAQKILQRDAWNEDATLLGMQAYIGLNSSPRAVHLYQKLEATLKADLDLQPRSDLRQLVESIKSARHESPYKPV